MRDEPEAYYQGTQTRLGTASNAEVTSRDVTGKARRLPFQVVPLSFELNIRPGVVEVVRNHKLSYTARKDRDYLIFERGPFEFAIGNLFESMLQSGEANTPMDINELLRDGSKSFHGHEGVTQDLFDRARDLSHKYFHTKSGSQVAEILLLLDMLREPIVAQAKMNLPKEI